MKAIVWSLIWSLVSPSLWADAPSGKDWLKSVADKTPLTKLHLPGTHNSAALFEPFRGTARCQSLTIKEQLNAGVRFLDIRCRHQNDEFSLYHGHVPQRQSFAELLETLSSFLNENPGEFVMVSIQETAKPTQNSRSFEDTAKRYFSQKKPLWNLTSKVPTLGQARGKALLLRRFPAKNKLGIDATDWGHSGFHHNEQLLIQDRFQLSNPDQKWNSVARLWQLSRKVPQLLSLNFTSGYLKNRWGLPNITAISDEINPQLLGHLSFSPTPPGILVLDFINPELSSAIYRLNFKEQ